MYEHWTESITRSVSLVDWAEEHAKTNYKKRKAKKKAKSTTSKSNKKSKPIQSTATGTRAEQITREALVAFNKLIALVNELNKSKIREVIDLSDD